MTELYSAPALFSPAYAPPTAPEVPSNVWSLQRSRDALTDSAFDHWLPYTPTHCLARPCMTIDVFPLPSVPAGCVVPRGHALTRKKTVKISDLQGESLISLSRNSPMRMRLEMALEATGATCRRSVDTTLARAASSMVAGGPGLTVVDPFTAERLRNLAIVCRPPVPTVPCEFSMVLPAHQPRPKGVNDFIHVMKELFDTGFTPA